MFKNCYTCHFYVTPESSESRCFVLPLLCRPLEIEKIKEGLIGKCEDWKELKEGK